MLEDTYKRLEKVPDLNCGGCGIAALAMIKYAEKLGIKVAIVFLYRSYAEDMADNNMSQLASGNVDAVEIPNHIALLEGDMVIDSEGNPLDRYQICHSGVTTEELLALIFQEGWNSHFSRRKSIPMIEEILDISLKEIK